MSIGEFIQNQVLKMQFLSDGIEKILLYLGLDKSSKIYQILLFFFYDTIKICLFLLVLIFFISFIQSYFSPQKTKEILSKIKGIKANFIAALLGTITPFCSCSSIPLFIGFKSAGIDNGVAFSFLISSPMVDLAAIAILSSIFGIKVTAIYVLFGIATAVIGGVIIQKLQMDDQIKAEIKHANFCCSGDLNRISIISRVRYAKNQTIKTLKNIFLFILIGVGIGAFIHNVVPTDFVEGILGNKNSFSVILATIVGIPIYADEFGTIPIAQSLLSKGAGLGTTLAFMMSVTIVSVPSLLMLNKVVKVKLLGLFLAIVMVATIILGYFFNFFQNYFIIGESYVF